jgi:hypothetical protein
MEQLLGRARAVLGCQLLTLKRDGAATPAILPHGVGDFLGDRNGAQEALSREATEALCRAMYHCIPPHFDLGS